jgi:PAS domain S-box-containing protein
MDHQDLGTLGLDAADLAEALKGAAIAMHWVGPDGRIGWANAAELALLGYSEEEYVGHHIAEFHADGDVEVDILHRLEIGEPLRRYEARLLAKDGSIRHVLLSSNGLRRDEARARAVLHPGHHGAPADRGRAAQDRGGAREHDGRAGDAAGRVRAQARGRVA